MSIWRKAFGRSCGCVAISASVDSVTDSKKETDASRNSTIKPRKTSRVATTSEERRVNEVDKAQEKFRKEVCQKSKSEWINNGTRLQPLIASGSGGVASYNRRS